MNFFVYCRTPWITVEYIIVIIVDYSDYFIQRVSVDMKLNPIVEPHGL